MKPTLKIRKENISKQVYFFPNDNGVMADGFIGDNPEKPNEPRMTLKNWIKAGDNISATPIDQKQ